MKSNAQKKIGPINSHAEILAWLASLPTAMCVTTLHLQGDACENADGNGRPKSTSRGGEDRTAVSSQHNKKGARTDAKVAIPLINKTLKERCGYQLNLEMEERTVHWPSRLQDDLIAYRKEKSTDPNYAAVSDSTLTLIATKTMNCIIGKKSTAQDEIDKLTTSINTKKESIAELESSLSGLSGGAKKEADKKLKQTKKNLESDEKKLRQLKGEEEPEGDEETSEAPAEARTNNALCLGSGEEIVLRRICRMVLDDLIADPDTQTNDGVRIENKTKARMKGVKESLTSEARLDNGPNLIRVVFGNMATSSLIEESDATLCMAHSFSVNRMDTRLDYMTASDDFTHLYGVGGAAFISEVELAQSYQLHTFFSFDVRSAAKVLLRDYPNLGIESTSILLEGVTGILLDWAARRGHGSKRSSTAPFAWANLVMVEMTNHQPVSHADAFVVPVPDEKVW